MDTDETIKVGLDGAFDRANMRHTGVIHKNVNSLPTEYSGKRGFTCN